MSLPYQIELDDGSTAFLMEQRECTLAVAVLPVDDYTGDRPLGHIQVVFAEIPRIVAGDKKPLAGLVNAGGYHLFFDAEVKNFQPQVQSEYYFDSKITPQNDPDPAYAAILKHITLKPLPSYPFPPGATLIRGMVQGGDENIYAQGHIQVSGRNVSNFLTPKGEFALYFPPQELTADKTIEDASNKKKYIKGNVGKIIHLTVTAGPKSGGVDLSAEEGKTTILAAPIILA